MSEASVLTIGEQTGSNTYNIVISIQWRTSAILLVPESDEQSGSTSTREETNRAQQENTQELEEQEESNASDEDGEDETTLTYLPTLHIVCTNQDSISLAVKRIFKNLLYAEDDEQTVDSFYGVDGQFVSGNIFISTDDHPSIKSVLFQSFVLSENAFGDGNTFSAEQFGRPSCFPANTVLVNNLLTPSAKHFVETLMSALRLVA